MCDVCRRVRIAWVFCFELVKRIFVLERRKLKRFVHDADVA
jgi:hypothetical protein